MSKKSNSEDDLLKEIERLRSRVAELEKSEEKYKIITDYNYDWEYLENADNDFTYVSPSCERLIGYSAKELMEKTVLIKDIVYPEDREIWQQHRHESEQELKLRKVQLRMRRKDGKIRWIEHACRPVINEKNEFLGFRVSNRDITDRKNTEWQLQLTETTINSSNFAIMWIRPDASMIFVNEAACALSGYTREELTSMTVPDFDPLWSRNYWNSEGWNRLKTEGVSLFESQLRHKDGNIIPTEVLVGYVGFEEGEYLFAFISDITERKQAQEALEYRLDFENLIASISNRFINIPTDEIDTGISFALKQLAEFADIDRSYLFLFSEDGKSMSCTHEWCRDGVQSQMEYLQDIHFDEEYPWFAERIKKHEVVYIPRVSELSIEAAPEKREWDRESIISLIDVPMISHKNLIGFVGFETLREEMHLAEDIIALLKIIGEMFVNAIVRKHSEEKAGEQELQLIHAAKMVSLGTLISGVAHEINNPNHYIRLNAEIMERLWKEISPCLKTQAERDENFRLLGMDFNKITEKVPLILRGMVDGTVRIQRIIESLRAFSSKNSGELNQMVDINVVAENAREITAYLIKKSTASFTLSLAEGLPEIRGNDQQLGQVIVNLITNSCQALGDMENGITISTFLSRKKDKLIVEVADEGAGIPPEVLPHIMDPFYTTKRDESSTGLGLSISYSIIKNHGGELIITSNYGQGTKARIGLPITHKKPEGKK